MQIMPQAWRNLVPSVACILFFGLATCKCLCELVSIGLALHGRSAPSQRQRPSHAAPTHAKLALLIIFIGPSLRGENFRNQRTKIQKKRAKNKSYENHLEPPENHMMIFCKVV